MTEIPEDIRETARQMALAVADRYVEQFDADLVRFFAEALVAERERITAILLAAEPLAGPYVHDLIREIRGQSS